MPATTHPTVSDRPTSVVVSIPAETAVRATTGLEVLTQVWPSGLVTADVRPAGSGEVWTPIVMAGGDVEMRP